MNIYKVYDTIMKSNVQYVKLSHIRGLGL